MVFDVDGTLVNSNDAHARAWVEVLSTFGFPVELTAVRRLIGMGGDKRSPSRTHCSRVARDARAQLKWPLAGTCISFISSSAANSGPPWVLPLRSFSQCIIEESIILAKQLH